MMLPSEQSCRGACVKRQSGEEEKMGAGSKEMAETGFPDRGWQGQKSIWRQKAPVSVLLWMALSILALVFLNNITAGTSDTCSWSLFGVWREEIGYLSGSTTLMYDIGYLFTGGASRWLWLYTFMHCVPAAILGWAGAAIIAMLCCARVSRG